MNRLLHGTRVVVIGAGFAGLAAATDLKALGADVVIIEARDRIGGRVFSDTSLGAPVDLGAAAIHGAIGNPLTVLAQAAGVQAQPLDYGSIVCYLADGARIADKDFEAAERRFDILRRDLCAQATDGESLAQTLRRVAPLTLDDPVLALLVGVEFEFDIGGALEEIGATGLDDHKPFSGGDLILPHGFDQLVSFLARELDVRLCSPVQHIAVSNTGVRVGGAFGSVDADYCICTVPIGVLKSQGIAFEPGLPPTITEAIDRLGAGHVTKIALKFDSVFWDNEPFYVGYASGLPGRFPYFLNLHAIRTDANILVTFALGDYDLGLKDQTDETIVRDAVAMLRDIYGAAVPAPSAVIVTRWSSDPFSMCSYSFASPQTSRADFDAFREVVQGRLLFAGEHTTADHRGTAHGAYMSGQQAAERIVSLVRATPVCGPMERDISGTMTSSWPVRVQPLSRCAGEGCLGEL